MYKVFYDNRSILFVDSFDTHFSRQSGLFYHFISAEHMQMVIKTFTKIKEIPHLFIISDNIEQTFQAYSQLYNIIEAGGGVVFSPENEILAIKRHGIWDLPKGKLEKGETPETGALREVEEECGLHALRPDGFLTHTYHTYSLNDQPILKKTHWFVMRHTKEAQLIPQTEEGITEVVWIPRHALHTLYDNTYASIKEVLKKAD